MARLRLSDEFMHRRIIVTGIGVVSACGRTASSFWEALTSLANSVPSAGTAHNLHHSVSAGIADFSGGIDDFCELPAVKRKAIQKSLKLMNRETQMGVAAGQQALQDSGLLQDYAPDRIGVCFGAENVSVMPEDFQAGVQACSDGNGGFDSDRWGVDGIPEVAPLWL